MPLFIPMHCWVHLGISAQVNDSIQVIAVIVIHGTCHGSNDCHWSVQMMINGIMVQVQMVLLRAPAHSGSNGQCTRVLCMPGHSEGRALLRSCTQKVIGGSVSLPGCRSHTVQLSCVAKLQCQRQLRRDCQDSSILDMIAYLS